MLKVGERERESEIEREISTELTCFEITGHLIKYSTVLWFLKLQIRLGRRV